MNGLRKVCFINMTLFIVTLLSILLIISCQEKKVKLDSSEDNEQNTTAAVENLSPPDQKETATASKQIKLPKLIDLGADKCIPCKMMAPILEELESEYAGRLEVVFIDVWKEPERGKEYGVRLIPTQIFYDADGNEFYRHEGFFSKEDILNAFKEKGIDFNEV